MACLLEWERQTQKQSCWWGCWNLALCQTEAEPNARFQLCRTWPNLIINLASNTSSTVLKCKTTSVGKPFSIYPQIIASRIRAVLVWAASPDVRVRAESPGSAPWVLGWFSARKLSGGVSGPIRLCSQDNRRREVVTKSITPGESSLPGLDTVSSGTQHSPKYFHFIYCKYSFTNELGKDWKQTNKKPAPKQEKRTSKQLTYVI